MPHMLRKQIYIDTRQDYLLKAKAAELHVSESELIREGIENILRTNAVALRDVKIWEQEKEFISSLMKRGPAKGGRTWKREDLYDR